MGEHGEYVEIDGHKVAPETVDRFYSGADGRRVTDEEWDVTRDRTRAFEGLSDEEALARLEELRRG